jgi:hypothetical protein
MAQPPLAPLLLLQAADWQLLGPLVAWQHMVRTIIQVGWAVRTPAGWVAHGLSVLCPAHLHTPPAGLL